MYSLCEASTLQLALFSQNLSEFRLITIASTVGKIFSWLFVATILNDSESKGRTECLGAFGPFWAFGLLPVASLDSFTGGFRSVGLALCFESNVLDMTKDRINI